jgi:hypothetical protein
VTSGDVAGIVDTVPEALRASIWHIGNVAFAYGFAAALLAAVVAAAMALFTMLLVRQRRDVAGLGRWLSPLGEHYETDCVSHPAQRR